MDSVQTNQEISSKKTIENGGFSGFIAQKRPPAGRNRRSMISPRPVAGPMGKLSSYTKKNRVTTHCDSALVEGDFDMVFIMFPFILGRWTFKGGYRCWTGSHRRRVLHAASPFKCVSEFINTYSRLGVIILVIECRKSVTWFVRRCVPAYDSVLSRPSGVVEASLIYLADPTPTI